MPTPHIHRRIIIAGNWKMNQSPGEAVAYFHDLHEAMQATVGNNRAQPWVKRVIFPVAYCLQPHVFEAAASCHTALGAQNVHWEDKGAFTGELSAVGLRHVGAHWCLIGHSERRQFFGETDQTAAKRLATALRHKLHVIYCIGEMLPEREAGKTNEVLAHQLAAAADVLKSVDHTHVNDPADETKPTVAIAYEPVWAIGTGKTATPVQAEEAHSFIREELGRLGLTALAAQMPLLYGGSVTPDNARALMSQPNVDGVLVGGASLKADGFLKIIQSVQ
jgi:triosephosphate isomerase